MKDCNDRSDVHIRRTAFQKTLVTAFWQSHSQHQHQLHWELHFLYTSYRHLRAVWLLQTSLNLQEHILQYMVCIRQSPPTCLCLPAIAADLKVGPPQLFAYLIPYLHSLGTSHTQRVIWAVQPACSTPGTSFAAQLLPFTVVPDIISVISVVPDCFFLCTLWVVFAATPPVLRPSRVCTVGAGRCSLPALGYS